MKMSNAELFENIIFNLKVSNPEEIKGRRHEIIKKLNKEIRDTSSDSDNSLMIGSYGRKTAIDGVSDLDLVYILPKGMEEEYKNPEGASKILDKIKSLLKDRYPKSDIAINRYIVRINFSNFKFEILPVFENKEGDFEYPDTYKGGSWKTTKPRKENKYFTDFSCSYGDALRDLCKMIRAWRNKQNLDIGGLLIDTLCSNFLDTNEQLCKSTYKDYGTMVLEFFSYIANLDKQEYLMAPGSNQRVYIKKRNFQNPAREAISLCEEALGENDYAKTIEKWKKVFGKPASIVIDCNKQYVDTEEFIEDSYAIDIKYNLRLDCKVSQNGFRPFMLSKVKGKWLRPNKKLEFAIENPIEETDGPLTYKWKVLNRGPEATRRNMIRGQIISGDKTHKEETNFQGEHYVECYAIDNSNIVVARSRIEVPIKIY